MFAKFIGLGFHEYFQDKFNIFDFFIVIVSSFDLALAYSPFGNSLNTGGGGVISAMRAFRLLRVFKLAKSWKKF